MQAETQQQHADRIQIVLEYIDGRLDQRINSEEIAKIAGFSLWHFHRIFRTVTGKPLGDYIRDKRLERAAEQLRDGDEAVVYIAYDAGYETHSGFTRAFRTQYSESPAQYRQSAKTDVKHGRPKAIAAVGISQDDSAHRLKGQRPQMLLREVIYANSRNRRNSVYGAVHSAAADAIGPHGNGISSWSNGN